MYNLLSMELYKLKYQKDYKILWLVLVGFILLFGVLSTTMTTNGVTGLSEFINSFNDTAIAMIFCAILSGFVIDKDFLNKTVNLQISSGHSRLNVLLGKVLSYFIIATCFYLTYPLGRTLFGTISFGWGAPMTGETFIYMCRVVVLGLLLNVGSCSYFVFIAFVCKDIAKCVTISILFVIFSGMVIPAIGNVVPIVKVLYDFSTFSQATRIVNEQIAFDGIITILLSAFITILTMVILSFWVFKKNDLH